MSARAQLNIRIDPEIERAIEDIRRMSESIPTVTGAVREAILRHRDFLARKEAKRK